MADSIDANRAMHAARFVALARIAAAQADGSRGIEAAAAHAHGVAHGLHIAGAIDAAQERVLTFFADAHAADAMDHVRTATASPSAPNSPADDSPASVGAGGALVAVTLAEMRALRQARSVIELGMTAQQCRAAIERLIADRACEQLTRVEPSVPA